jgi:hypothetical protein
MRSDGTSSLLSLGPSLGAIGAGGAVVVPAQLGCQEGTGSITSGPGTSGAGTRLPAGDEGATLTPTEGGGIFERRSSQGALTEDWPSCADWPTAPRGQRKGATKAPTARAKSHPRPHSRRLYAVLTTAPDPTDHSTNAAAGRVFPQVAVTKDSKSYTKAETLSRGDGF